MVRRIRADGPRDALIDSFFGSKNGVHSLGPVSAALTKAIRGAGHGLTHQTGTSKDVTLANHRAAGPDSQGPAAVITPLRTFAGKAQNGQNGDPCQRVRIR